MADSLTIGYKNDWYRVQPGLRNRDNPYIGIQVVIQPHDYRTIQGVV